MNVITYLTDLWETEGLFVMGVSAVLSCKSVQMLYNILV